MPEWYQRAAWNILRRTRGPRLLRFYNVRAEFRDPEPREPYILLSNHAHALDPWVIGSLLSRTIRYMANLEGTRPLKAVFADIVGAYGKRKGAPDFVSLRRTLDLAKAGETIGIFPEGDRSWDGSPSPLRPGLGRLLRMLGLPVLLARQEGSYLSGPRWASFPRQGQWNVLFRVIPREQVLSAHPEDLDTAIAEALAVDDMKNPALRALDFRCRAPAKGIERLLWLCPACGGSDTISGEENRIACSACGSSWIVDANQRIEDRGGRGFSVPVPDLRSWSDLQKRSLEDSVHQAKRLGLFATPEPGHHGPLVSGERLPDPRASSILASDRVELLRKNDKGVAALGRGRLALFRDALAFRAEGGGSHALFDVGKVKYFVDNFNVYSEFSYGPERYRVQFGGGNAVKWIHALSILQRGDGGVAI